jgi:hypothetical protein
MVTVADAGGNPVRLDMNNPVIRNKTLAPETMKMLPDGARLEYCTLLAGDYDLTDATLDNCRTDPDSALLLRGNAVVTTSTLRGRVALAGETLSSGNVYHSPVHFLEEAQSSEDCFLAGYDAEAESTPVIDLVRTTMPVDEHSGTEGFGNDEEADTAPESTGDSRRGRASRAVANIGRTLAWSLMGGPRRRRGSRGTVAQGGGRRGRSRRMPRR